ncbi:hypothetical protein CEXT_811491 [Caerostris extrusa]|uniref:Uncharacterized protein n=1 Tax=Caerostris extrusa TaxID=172846 RepID=A0AAV4TJL2_CAEEX|nr:hypothetical protein CEXT_811491 [Caerostris extrusa]
MILRRDELSSRSSEQMSLPNERDDRKVAGQRAIEPKSVTEYTVPNGISVYWKAFWNALFGMVSGRTAPNLIWGLETTSFRRGFKSGKRLLQLGPDLAFLIDTLSFATVWRCSSKHRNTPLIQSRRLTTRYKFLMHNAFADKNTTNIHHFAL